MYEKINLDSWREFRNSLQWFDDDEKILKTMDYWSNAPMVNYVLDWDKPDSWITPWEIINDDYYDTNAIAYMMSETLILSGFDASRIRLEFIQDKIDSSRLMILVIDNRYVLNYSYNEIVEYSNIKNRIIKYVEYIKDGEKYVNR